jgi:hypothetical protein
MNTQIETLDEAIEAGLRISAVYAPNGEVVKCDFDAHSGTTITCEFQDGSIDEVAINDLIDFTWK